jgi:hypothetical protein
VKTKIIRFLCLLITLPALATVACAQTTAFTYQGKLTDGSAPASGLHDFEFKLHADNGGDAQVGETVSVEDVNVNGGLFTVALDFGGKVFDGRHRWLEIAVRPGASTGAYTTLDPRQPVTSTPYAVKALEAAKLPDDAVSATMLANGAVKEAKLGSGAVTTDKIADGTITVGDVNVASFNMSFWNTGGNAGTSPSTQFLGTTDNQPVELRVNAQRALLLVPNPESPNIIGGSSWNKVGIGTGGAVIGGGGNFDFPNETAGQFATVTGGRGNTASGFAATAMGDRTTASGNTSTALGSSTIAGGGASVAMGTSSIANGNFSVAAGYRSKAMHDGAFVWADPQEADFASTANNQFSVRASGGVRLETGGAGLMVDGLAVPTGPIGSANLADGSVIAADLNAGTFDTTFWRAGGNAGTNPGTHFMGTTDNQPLELKVNGQRGLRIEPTARGWPNVIGGSQHNVAAGLEAITIAGGLGNNIEELSDQSAIGGGTNGYIGANSAAATIAGGTLNRILRNCNVSVIGGGGNNTIRGDPIMASSTTFATIAGGNYNEIKKNSSYSAIGGGWDNRIEVDSPFATIPGGHLNTAVDYAFAAGHRAKAVHTGAFVWADSTDADFASTADNQFNIRAMGGVRLSNETSLNFGNQTRQMINLWNAEYGIGVQSSAAYFRTNGEFFWYKGGSHSDAFGDAGGGAQLMRLGSTGNLVIAGTLSSASDRNIKQDFADVDLREVLDKVVALPVQTWTYTRDPGNRHLGPVAQDFHAAFGLNGDDDKHIATVDADGVALAAIKGLNAKVDDHAGEVGGRIRKLEVENAALKDRLERLEQLLKGHP